MTGRRHARRVKASTALRAASDSAAVVAFAAKMRLCDSGSGSSTPIGPVTTARCSQKFRSSMTCSFFGGLPSRFRSTVFST